MSLCKGLGVHFYRSKHNVMSCPPDISSDFIMPSTGNKSFECSEWFYFDENGTEFCRPICGEISPKSLGLQIVEKAAVCMGFVACVIMFILALTVQRKSL